MSGRPKDGYRLADGTKVAGVTTIISRFKNAGGLIYWAWQQGKDGKDFRETRDAAADAGTLAHAMVEAHLKGEAPEVVGDSAPKEIREKAETAFLGFLEWAGTMNLRVVEQELSLVSEAHRFGGTLDCCVLTINDRLTIGDWKTSNGLYPDHLIQVAAYRGLFMENFPDRPLAPGGHIMRFNKETGDFHHHFFQDLTMEWEQFLLFRQAFDNDKIIAKRAK